MTTLLKQQFIAASADTGELNKRIAAIRGYVNNQTDYTNARMCDVNTALCNPYARLWYVNAKNECVNSAMQYANATME
jgi:hypothetical protein